MSRGELQRDARKARREEKKARLRELQEPKSLPAAITSYDLLKTVAILLMLADHAGFYFFPDHLWWRVAGRLCVPMWFFLIGYARSRDVGRRLWIAAFVLTLADLVTGLYLLPLNILFTLLAVRLTIDPVVKFVAGGRGNLAIATVALVVAVLPTLFLTDYGTAGMLLALCGWFACHRGDDRVLERIGPSTVRVFLGVAWAGFVLPQALLFRLPPAEAVVMGAGCLAVFGLLSWFRPEVFPGLTARLGPAAAAIRFTGRRTLEIYVVHLILLKVLGAILYPERFPALAPKWSFAGL